MDLGGVSGVIGRRLASGVAQRLKVAALGEPQRRAVEGAVRQKSEAVTARHPAIAQISADIDLFGSPTVVDEVIGRASNREVGAWPAASARWQQLYGTEPTDEMRSFLEDLASELGPTLRSHPELQDVFLVHSADATADAIRTLGDRVDAQTNPVKAVRYRGEEIGADFGLVSEILGQVGAEMSRGPLGSIEVDATLTGEGARFHIRPKAGADVRFNFTVEVPNTEEGRLQLSHIRDALYRGVEPVALPGGTVELMAEGKKVGSREFAKATVEPAVLSHRAFLEFRSRGLKPECFLVDLEVRPGLGAVHAQSPKGTTRLLRAQLVIEASGQIQVHFEANTAGLTVSRQLKLARLGRHLKRGCSVLLWIEESDVLALTTMPPNPVHEAADRLTSVLTLFEEVRRRSATEVETVEEITSLDLAWLHSAKRLLDTGEAWAPGRGGTFTSRSEDDPRPNVPESSVHGGFLAFRLVERDFVLPLSRHPLSLGPAPMRFRGKGPPIVRQEDGVFVWEVECDPKRRIKLIRHNAEPDEPWEEQ